MFARIPVIDRDIDHFEMIDNHSIRLGAVDGRVECVRAHGKLREERRHFGELECSRRGEAAGSVRVRVALGQEIGRGRERTRC